MKKLLLLSSLLTFLSINAQNIIFADANFKSALLNSYNGSSNTFIDTDNDNEISQAEALLVSKIDTYYTEINDLTGIEFFINIKSYNSLFYKAPSFNFPTLVNLEEISLANALTGFVSINDLDLSMYPNLKKVTCAINGNTNLNGLTNLRFISLSGSFTQIDLSDCTNLLELYLTAPVTSLNLSNNTKLINLSLLNTEFLNLDLSACTNLEIVYANKGKMETLNLGEIKYIRYLFVQENKLISLNTNNLFNLQQFNCSDNNLSSLSIKNDNLIFGDNSGIDFSKNTNLQSICCDANEIIYIQNQCNLLGYTTNVSECIPPPVEARQLTMFPNPVKDMLHLDCSDKINKVEVFGSNGLLLMTSETITDLIDMQSFANGMYFLKVYRDNSVDDMKFIKG
jgi:Secretion system C-terminal sorting domain